MYVVILLAILLAIVLYIVTFHKISLKGIDPEEKKQELDSFLSHFESPLSKEAATEVFYSLIRLQIVPSSPDQDLMRDFGLVFDEFDDEFYDVAAKFGIDNIHESSLANELPLLTVKDYVSFVEKMILLARASQE